MTGLPSPTENPSPAAGASAKADATGQAAPKGGNPSRKIVRQAELEGAAPGTTQERRAGNYLSARSRRLQAAAMNAVSA